MELITTGKAARICGVGLNTIKSWIKGGHIKGIQLPSGHWRIPLAELDRFLATSVLADNVSEAGDAEIIHSAKRCRVLVVDDDPHIHAFVEDSCLLAGIDAEFVFCSDGFAGLIEIGRFKPDLLVLDIMMPQINGLELIQRLKQDAMLASTMPILVMTGAQDKRLVMHRLEQAGPDAILHKPVAAAALVAEISRLLADKGCKKVAVHGS